jgi:hypothetical protein
MPLTADQSGWLNRFTGGMLDDPSGDDPWQGFLRARAGETASERAYKDELIEQAHERLESQKEAMRAAFDMQVTMKDGKKLRTLDKRGRQEEAFDTEETSQVAAGPDVRALKSAHNMMALIVQEKDRLTAVESKRSVWKALDQRVETEDVRLFTDTEIMEEFYTPLVRQLVLPENFVPDQFSATQHLIQGSNELYKKDSKTRHTDFATGGIELTQGALSVAASLAKEIVHTTTNLATVDGVTTLADTSNVGLSLDQQTRASTIADGVALVLSAGVGVMGEVEKLSHEKLFKQSTWQTIAYNTALGVGTAVTGATNNIEIGLAVTDAVSGAIGTVAVAAYVARWRRKGGEFPAQAVLEEAGSAVGGALKAMSDTTTGPTSKMYADIAVSLDAALRAGAAAKSAKVQAAFRTGKWEDVLPEVMLEIAKDAGNAAASEAARHNLTDEAGGPSDLHADAQLLNHAVDDEHAASGIASAGTKSFHAIKRANEPVRAKHVNTMKTQVDELVAKGKTRTEAISQVLTEASNESNALRLEVADAVDEMEREHKSYQASLNRLTKSDPADQDYKSIAKLTEQLKRDRAVVDAAFNLVQAGLAIDDSVSSLDYARTDIAKPVRALPGASASIRFYGPIMGASELVKCVKNLYAVAQRLTALRDWMNSRQLATSSANPLATSVQNFIRNNAQQCGQDAVQTVLKLASAVSNFSEAVHPIMRASTLALEVVTSTEEALYRFYKQRQLIAAWKLTKQALDNPKNRKLGLIVRGLNPTLAKYTIAYGAMVEKDQVAIAALNKVGLDRETLMRASSKVGDVVNYLQALYRDDNVIFAEIETEPGKTKVPPPALTVRAWSMSYRIWAERDGLIGDNPPGIVAGLVKVEKFAATVDHAAREAEIDRYEQVLGKLEEDFRAIIPMTESGIVLKAAQAVIEEYANLAGAHCVLVRQALAEDAPGSPSAGRRTGLSNILTPPQSSEVEETEDDRSEIEPTPPSPI